MKTPTLEAIWEKYRGRLLVFLRGKVSDDGEAEDLLQEIFIRIHHHFCCLPPPEKMDSWVYQIARNLITDHYRRRRKNVELSPDIPDESEHPDENPQAALALSLKDMVDKLPEPYRQALFLVEYQGLSQVELARKLGLSSSGAKSRVQRARDKLREMILTCCHIELDRRGRVIEYSERCCCCNPKAH